MCETHFFSFVNERSVQLGHVVGLQAHATVGLNYNTPPILPCFFLAPQHTIQTWIDVETSKLFCLMAWCTYKCVLKPTEWNSDGRDKTCISSGYARLSVMASVYSIDHAYRSWVVVFSPGAPR